MKVTLLGHASVVVEADGAIVMMDPVFSDPFQGDLVVSCPSRQVYVDRLPRPDVLIMSHNHLDHFHLPSLRRLPAELPVFIPQDGLLLRMMRRAGFHNITTVAPGETVQQGALCMRFTRSMHANPEMGVVFESPDGSVWNQVDTVITQQSTVEVLGWLQGRLDVVFCAWRPLLEYCGMWVDEVDFPKARYDRLLEMAICSRATTVVPGSAGLRAADRYGWANHRLFPASRQQFAKDLHRLAPDTGVLLMNPGHTLRLRAGHRPSLGQSRWARTVAMDEHLTDFDPDHHPPPALVDLDPPGFGKAGLRQGVAALMEQSLPEVLERLLTWDLVGPLRTLWDRRSVLQMDVVFPGDEVRSWQLAGWDRPLRVRRGGSRKADYTWRYIASQLLAYAAGRPYGRTVQAFRRDGGVPGRLDTLDPARLHDVDLYRVVDEDFAFNPLALLAE